jgi:hypothetical protein
MSPIHFPGHSGAWILIALAIPGLLLLSAGCTSYSDLASATPSPVAAASTPAETTITSVPAGTSGLKDVAVTAEKIGDSTIVITYLGGADAGRLLELQTTVVDDRGSVSTRTLGSRLETMPVQRGGTSTFNGPFSNPTHVITVGFFADGSFQGMFDGWI